MWFRQILYKPRQAEETVEIKSIDDLAERVSSFDRDIVKLKNGRLGPPDGPPAIGLMNKGVVNRTGQTKFHFATWYHPNV